MDSGDFEEEKVTGGRGDLRLTFAALTSSSLLCFFTGEEGVDGSGSGAGVSARMSERASKDIIFSVGLKLELDLRVWTEDDGVGPVAEGVGLLRDNEEEGNGRDLDMSPPGGCQPF